LNDNIKIQERILKSLDMQIILIAQHLNSLFLLILSPSINMKLKNLIS